jgi:hypothetical protein
MNIEQIIIDSLDKANSEHDKETDVKLIHRDRSKNFVKSLAKELKEYYKEKSGVYILSKHSKHHRREFGLNELQFDILVCETNQVTSSDRKKHLTYVTKAIWQIESEFSRNSREALHDFNKLVLGTSENKLFIGPQVSNQEGYLKTLEKPASHCDSNTYVALVPHPSEWKQESLDVRCWIFRDGWEEIL